MSLSAPPSLASLTTLVLAGGLGTRLRPVVSDRPKALAEVGGRPFLAHLLGWLEGQGVRRVILCTGYLGEAVEAAFGDRQGALSLLHSREPEPLGTAGALAWALRHPVSDPMLVLNGDAFLETDLGAFLAWYQALAVRQGVLLMSVPDRSAFGGVELGEGGRIERFLEKGAAGPGPVNAGVYLLHPEDLRALPLDRPTSLERDCFPSWAGRTLYGFQADGSFHDIGTPESYRAADAFTRHPSGGS